MKKALLISLGLCVSFSTVQAAPFKNSSVHHPLQAKLAKESKFTDFSGTWTSPSCHGVETTIVIENNENSFSVNNEEMTIGTLDTNATSGSKDVFQLSTRSDIHSVEWNDDKTQLIYKEVSVDKAFDIQDTPGRDVDKSMYIDIENVILSLENDTLKIQFNSATYKDLQKIDSSRPTCTFTKVTTPE